MPQRPRFSPEIEKLELQFPPGKKLGGVIACDFSPEGNLFVIHQFDPPGVDVSHLNPDDYLPYVARFAPDGSFIDAWGGPDHIPRVVGVSQWPAGVEGLECDADGNVWVFGYTKGDDAVLKFSPTGELLLRIGQRERNGGDADTATLGCPTSCYHDTKAREVFVSDGYANHRVISFDSDTGEFIRMWGAYGKHPAECTPEESYANPVHKVAVGPGGLLYVCDRIKNRVQEFERIPGGVKYLREVHVGPGTMQFGSCFDLAFTPCQNYMLVSDGSNQRVWSVDLASFEVLGWASAATETEGDGNVARIFGILHRMRQEPNGDLLLCCTTQGIKRMKYLGVG